MMLGFFGFWGYSKYEIVFLEVFIKLVIEV